jgi:hypothetical protein
MKVFSIKYFYRGEPGFKTAMIKADTAVNAIRKLRTTHQLAVIDLIQEVTR